MTAEQRVLYNRLDNSYYIRSRADGLPVPVISNDITEGVVAAVYGDRDLAAARAQQLGETYGVLAEPYPVGGLMDAACRFARLGLAGLVLDDQYDVMFFNAVADPDRTLPTLGCLITPESGPIWFGAGGPLIVCRMPIMPWADYSLLDRMSVRWVLEDLPPPNLSELWGIFPGQGTGLRLENGATLLGPFVSDEGAVPVFNNRARAEYFAEVSGISLADAADGKPQGKCSIRPIPECIFEFLESVRDKGGPGLDIGLNPECHRYNQGYFFEAGPSRWRLRTLKGVFRLSPDGTLVASDDLPPKGDTVRQGAASQNELAGVSSVLERPFTRLTGKNTGLLGIDEAKARLKKRLLQADGRLRGFGSARLQLIYLGRI